MTRRAFAVTGGVWSRGRLRRTAGGEGGGMEAVGCAAGATAAETRGRDGRGGSGRTARQEGFDGG